MSIFNLLKWIELIKLTESDVILKIKSLVFAVMHVDVLSLLCSRGLIVLP